MKQFRYINSLIVFALLLCNAAVCIAYELKDAIVDVYASNPVLKKARRDMMIAENELKKGITGFLPTVYYSAQSQKEELKGASADPYKLYMLSVEQPIFRGFATVTEKKLAGVEFNSAIVQYRSVASEVYRQAVYHYQSVIIARKILNFALKNRNVMRNHLKFTRTKFDLGELTKTSVLAAEAKLAKADAQLSQAQYELDTACVGFEQVIGVSPTDDLKEIDLPNSLLPSTVDEYIEAVMANNFSVKNAYNGMDSAKLLHRLSLTKFSPTVSFNLSTANADMYSSLRPDYTRYTLSVNVPIFDKGVKFINAKSAKHRAAGALEDLARVQNEVHSKASGAWYKYHSSVAMLAAMEKEITAAENSLAGLTEEMKSGTRTMIEVLDAELECFRVKIEHEKVMMRMVSSIYEMFHYLGYLQYDGDM